MPSKTFALKPGAPKILKLDWSNNWENVDVFLNGNKVATIPDKESLLNGFMVELPNGTPLELQLSNRLGIPRLRISYNGAPLPGTIDDPYYKLTLTRRVMLLLGFANILVGLFNLSSDIKVFTLLGTSTIFIGWGILFLGLGFFWKRNPRLVLLFAIGGILLGGVLDILFAVYHHVLPSSTDMLVRGVILYIFIRGFIAWQNLRETKMHHFRL